MRFRTIIIAGLVVIGGGAALYWAFQPHPLAVDLATIGTGDLVVTVDEEGQARIRDTYEVTTPIGGDVQRIAFKVGDPVSEGMVLASVAPQQSAFLDARSQAEAEAAVRTAEAAVEGAETDISGAEAEVTYWQGEVDRTMTLLNRGATTLQAADQATLNLKRAEVALSTAKAILELRKRELAQAEARLLSPNGIGESIKRLDILAPISGEILAVNTDGSRSLPAGTTLVTVGDPHDLEIEAELLSADAVRLELGAPATISRWGGTPALEARLRRIEPVGFTKVSALGVEEQRVLVHLDIISDPALWRELGHRYRVYVQIEAERVADAVLVPTAALFREETDWAVYAVEDGLARLKRLALGARDTQFAVVTAGLAPGDRVILHPNDQIGDGTQVEDRAAMAAQ